MDVLSDVLDTVRLRSTAFGQAYLPAPWGLRAEATSHYAFHVFVRGRCWLEVEGRKPVEIEAGDVVVVSPGRSHVLRDSPKTPARPLSEWIAAGVFAPGARPPPDDRRPQTQVVCGCFRFETAAREVMAAALPPVLHNRDLSSEAGLWLAHTIKLLERETRGDQPGAATVMERLCDALFVYILRTHLASLPPDKASWLRAMMDPHVGAAMRLIHETPADAWTVQKLAARVGMSRSAFASRFATVAGETPLQYLLRWRAQKAAVMLRASTDAITEIASRVGYASEAAFNKAFKRMIGQAPGAYRQAVLEDA
jgi:AraC-like DNA-binding protein